MERKNFKKLINTTTQNLVCSNTRSCERAVRGFSLVEMIISLSIIGFVSLMALPSVIAQLAGYDIETSAKEISSALIVARVKAIDTRMPHRVKFDLASTPQRFIIQRGTTSRGVTTWIDDVTINEVRGDVKINRVEDVKGYGKTAGIGSVEFGPMGNPTKGVIYLEDSEGERYTVALNSASGKVVRTNSW